MARFKQFEVIVVPFPYSDSPKSKNRPALVLSDSDNFDGKTGHSVCAMITSAKNKSWPLDIEVTDLKSCGLPAPSVVRMKLFTIDHQIIKEKIGELAHKDKALVTKSLKAVIPLL
ncbi:MAG TPA: type II toxin-antitoxin system PemK/MazF family toxin [Pseudobdellovibrionaceae bacterium]|jgi:mRNA interferase MazF